MALQQQNVQKTSSRCIIAFGSNLSNEFGASVQLLEAALGQLSSRGLSRVEVSRFYRTPAFPKGNGPDFANGVVLCETFLSAPEVLEVLHEIESDLGRQRKTRWEARVIDLDLIDFDGKIVPDGATFKRWKELPMEQQMQEAPDELILPHPRLQDRLFVLVPIMDVQSNWRHPVSGKSVGEMIAEFDEAALSEIVPIL